MPKKYIPLGDFMERRNGKRAPDYGLEIIHNATGNTGDSYRCKWCKVKVRKGTGWVCKKKNCKALTLMVDGGWWRMGDEH